MEERVIIDKNEITIIFGTGDILLKGIAATGNEDKKKYYGIGFSQIEEGEIGRRELKYKDIKLPQPVKFLFPNIESIETVIKGLTEVKEYLKKQS